MNETLAPLFIPVASVDHAPQFDLCNNLVVATNERALRRHVLPIGGHHETAKIKYICAVTKSLAQFFRNNIPFLVLLQSLAQFFRNNITFLVFIETD